MSWRRDILKVHEVENADRQKNSELYSVSDIAAKREEFSSSKSTRSLSQAIGKESAPSFASSRKNNACAGLRVKTTVSTRIE